MRMLDTNEKAEWDRIDLAVEDTVNLIANRSPEQIRSMMHRLSMYDTQKINKLGIASDVAIATFAAILENMNTFLAGEWSYDGENEDEEIEIEYS